MSQDNIGQDNIVWRSRENVQRMNDTLQPPRPSLVHRAMYGQSELRAGWRLLLFGRMIAALLYATNFIFGRLFFGKEYL